MRKKKYDKYTEKIHWTIGKMLSLIRKKKSFVKLIRSRNEKDISNQVKSTHSAVSDAKIMSKKNGRNSVMMMTMTTAMMMTEFWHLNNQRTRTRLNAGRTVKVTTKQSFVYHFQVTNKFNCYFLLFAQFSEFHCQKKMATIHEAYSVCTSATISVQIESIACFGEFTEETKKTESFFLAEFYAQWLIAFHICR